MSGGARSGVLLVLGDRVVLMPAKKLYELLYSRTCSRQKRQYSPARSRPFGARCVAAAAQSGHFATRKPRVTPAVQVGLTLIRSNSGEFELIVISMRS